MGKKSTVTVGLIGCGVVGQGVLKILQKNLDLLEATAGASIRLKWMCDLRPIPMPKSGPQRPRFSRDWVEVVTDPEVDIVVELIGGYEPARTMVLHAIDYHKHIATANKALLAKYWGEVHQAARKNGSLVYFEAAVGGGIPVVQGLTEGLAANRVERIYGILNGTTNYILTRMTKEGLDFQTALAEAQKAGFAEADPSFDIEGTDAAHKIAILASIASGGWVKLQDVTREGITRLDVWDVRFAQEQLGLVLKLLGIARVEHAQSGEAQRTLVRVHPTLIPASHPFANVNHEYNAVFAHGDAVGDVMFYGKGAGQLAAASAVVSDITYLARQVANGTAGQIPFINYNPRQKVVRLPMAELASRHYLRFTTVDKPGVLSKITGVLGEHQISIAQVHQAVPDAAAKKGVPIVIVTHEAPEGAVTRALRQTDRLSVVLKDTVHLRIDELK